MTGLADFANHYPRQLSGGMRQRAAICRALLKDPDILFMDEPFGALDAMTRDSMNEELYELWRRSGKTIVFVTHDMAEAVRVGTYRRDVATSWGDRKVGRQRFSAVGVPMPAASTA